MLTTSLRPFRSISATSMSVPNLYLSEIACFRHVGFSYQTSSPESSFLSRTPNFPRNRSYRLNFRGAWPPTIRSGNPSPLISPTDFPHGSRGPAESMMIYLKRPFLCSFWPTGLAVKKRSTAPNPTTMMIIPTNRLLEKILILFFTQPVTQTTLGKFYIRISNDLILWDISSEPAIFRQPDGK